MFKQHFLKSKPLDHVVPNLLCTLQHLNIANYFVLSFDMKSNWIVKVYSIIKSFKIIMEHVNYFFIDTIFKLPPPKNIQIAPLWGLRPTLGITTPDLSTTTNNLSRLETVVSLDRHISQISMILSLLIPTSEMDKDSMTQRNMWR